MMFQFGIVSLLSSKKNEKLEISLDFLKQIFQSMATCEYFLFVFSNQSSQSIHIQSKESQVYENLRQVFITFQPNFQHFDIVHYVNENRFEIFLMGKGSEKSKIEYFNSKKAKLGLFSQSNCLRLSFILNKTSMEIFPLFFDKGKQKNEETIAKLLKKYLDKIYDLVFIVGSVDENIDLSKTHPDYEHVFENSVVSKKDGFSNQITILCSRKMISDNLSPMEKDVDIDASRLAQDFTLNCKIFVVFGHDN